LKWHAARQGATLPGKEESEMTDHHRRSIRLRDYDYTQDGAYFVTVCTHERRCLFGHVVDGAMVLNTWGHIMADEWERTAIVRPGVMLDAFVVMPNHAHAVIVIMGGVDDAVGAQCIAPLPKHGMTPNNVAPDSLGAIVRGFKAAVTRRINRLPDAPDHPVWQRNYYEHIIRNEESLNQIRAYIATNPARWSQDSLFMGGL
jgi:putative transposase